MQKTRLRTLKAGAKFTDTNGKRHGGGAQVHLTLAQEWHFRDQLTPSGPLDPTHEPTAQEIEDNEGRESIDLGSSAPAAAPAAPQGGAPGAPAPQAPAGAPTPAAAPQGAPQGDGGTGTHPIHDLNVAEASELVASAGTPEALKALEEAEERHPKHEGGRAGVKRAIEARRAELAG